MLDITKNLNIEINNLKIFSGSFFFCPENKISTLFNFNNNLTSITVNNLAITNTKNC